MSKITFPKSIADIASVLGVSSSSDSGNLEWVCTRNSVINQWARYKPTNGGGKLNRATRDNNTDEKRFVTYGLAYYNGNQLVPNKNILGNKIIDASDIPTVNCFNLKQTNLNYCRLQDFNGYDNDAFFNLDNSNYRCFPDETVGNGQTGFFYNRGGVALQFHSNKTSGLNTTPLIYDGTTNYCSLDVEDIIAESIHQELGEFQIGNFKLGIAFIFSNENNVSSDTDWYLFSTGRDIKTLLTSSSATSAVLSFTKDNVDYEVGNIVYGNKNFLLTLNRLTLFETWLGSRIFTANSYENSRIQMVLIKGATNNVCELFKNPSLAGSTPSMEVYHFSPSRMENNDVFGKRTNFSIKKALSYENITSKTNDTNRRTAGVWFPGDERNASNPACWYEYTNSNSFWRWNLKTEYQSESYREERKFENQCYLELISGDTTFRNAGHWVKFKLRLRGYVCHEFRSKYPDLDNSTYKQYYFSSNDVDINAKGSVKLFPTTTVNGTSVGGVNVEFYKNNTSTYYELFSSSGLEIDGIYGNNSHIFNNLNYFVGDKNYQDESSSGFHKCCSELMNVDSVKYNNTIHCTADYDSDEIFIYVQKTVFNTNPYADFYLYFKYYFKVDNEINPVDEEYEVSNSIYQTLRIKYKES